MEQQGDYKFKMNMCARRRLDIQHNIDENFRQRRHQYALKACKHREQQFHREINRLRKNLEQIRPYTQQEEDDDDSNTRDIPLTPNGFTRIQNHFHLLHFSAQTQNRLLCQAPSFKTIPKQQTPISSPKKIRSKSASYEIDQCQKRISFYQSRLPIMYSCRTSTDYLPFSSSKSFFGKAQYEKTSMFIEQCKHHESMKQSKNFQRKENLLKEFDQLKYTIDDPHSALSVLAALSRALVYGKNKREFNFS